MSAVIYASLKFIEYLDLFGVTIGKILGFIGIDGWWEICEFEIESDVIYRAQGEWQIGQLGMLELFVFVRMTTMMISNVVQS